MSNLKSKLMRLGLEDFIENTENTTVEEINQSEVEFDEASQNLDDVSEVLGESENTFESLEAMAIKLDKSIKEGTYSKEEYNLVHKFYTEKMNRIGFSNKLESYSSEEASNLTELYSYAHEGIKDSLARIGLFIVSLLKKIVDALFDQATAAENYLRKVLGFISKVEGEYAWIEMSSKSRETFTFGDKWVFGNLRDYKREVIDYGQARIVKSLEDLEDFLELIKKAYNVKEEGMVASKKLSNLASETNIIAESIVAKNFKKPLNSFKSSRIVIDEEGNSRREYLDYNDDESNVVETANLSKMLEVTAEIISQSNSMLKESVKEIKDIERLSKSKDEEIHKNIKGMISDAQISKLVRIHNLWYQGIKLPASVFNQWARRSTV